MYNNDEYNNDDDLMPGWLDASMVKWLKKHQRPQNLKRKCQRRIRKRWKGIWVRLYTNSRWVKLYSKKHRARYMELYINDDLPF